MKAVVGIIMYIVVVAEVGFLLLPTTAFYLSGLFAATLLALGEQGERSVPGALWVLFVLLVIGYALFTVWWLAIRFYFLKLKDVPIFILVGLAIGLVASVFFILPIVGNLPDNLELGLTVGGGPLILLVTLIVFMSINGGWQDSNPSFRGTQQTARRS